MPRAASRLLALPALRAALLFMILPAIALSFAIADTAERAVAYTYDDAYQHAAQQPATEERQQSGPAGEVPNADVAWLQSASVAATGVAAESGSINYGALDDLGRPTGVTARLTPDMVGTGSPAARSITPPGFGGGAAGHSRGHLLGNQLGGSGTDARNLVAMFQNPANSPVMRGFENQVRAALDAGQVVDYAATPIYRGSAGMPVSITLRAQGSGGLDFFVSVLNRGR